MRETGDTNQALPGSSIPAGSPPPAVLESGKPAAADKTEMPSKRWPGIGRLLGFFALTGLLVFATDALVTIGLRRIKTSTFGVWNQIFDGTIGAEIVVTGSSRAMVHYDSRIIQKITGRTTFNIGVNGSQTDMQVATLEAYLQCNPKPKLVVHNLDMFSFVTSRALVDASQYVPYLGNDTIFTALNRVYSDAWKWKYLPLYGYIVEDMNCTWFLGLKGLVGLHPREDHFQGFVPRNIPWTGDFEKFRKNNPHGVKFEIEPAGVGDIRNLVEICQRYGIPLLFVYSPEHSEMRALQNNRDEVFALFRKFSTRFRLEFWDYSDSPLCHDRANFYNSQHLNSKGASRFSTELAVRLATSPLVKKD